MAHFASHTNRPNDHDEDDDDDNNDGCDDGNGDDNYDHDEDVMVAMMLIRTKATLQSHNRSRSSVHWPKVLQLMAKID